jgi:hypothetical protein
MSPCRSRVVLSLASVAELFCLAGQSCIPSPTDTGDRGRSEPLTVTASGPATATGGSTVQLVAVVQNTVGAISFSWAVTSTGTGGTVTVQNSSSETMSATFSQDAAGSFSFTVTASDTYESASDMWSVVVTPDNSVKSDIAGGTYTDDVDATFIVRINLEVVANEKTSVAATALFNDQGEHLSLTDGTPMAAGYTGTFESGELTFTKTVTSIVYRPDSVTVRGTMSIDIHSQPGNPAIGTFYYTYKWLPPNALDYDENISASTRYSSQWPDTILIGYTYSGILTK